MASSNINLSASSMDVDSINMALPNILHNSSLELTMENKALLVRAFDVPINILDKMKAAGTGDILSQNQSFFSLGNFMIHASLLQSHPTQRPLDSSHIGSLIENFEAQGVLRMDNKGVVIGCGDGWLEMRNPTPQTFMITPATPGLETLFKHNEDGTLGPIAHIIRGNHRTAAIQQFATHDGMENQGFWCYEVLSPGLCWFIFVLHLLIWFK
jgi:hypothetical protein